MMTRSTLLLQGVRAIEVALPEVQVAGLQEVLVVHLREVEVQEVHQELCRHLCHHLPCPLLLIHHLRLR